MSWRRSREGAWIEIGQIIGHYVNSASRSREGAWIEIAITIMSVANYSVAPARERGLKYQQGYPAECRQGSLPRGSVD